MRAAAARSHLRGLRVTAVIGGLGGGGAERVCVNLANAWAARGLRVTILTLTGSVPVPAYAVSPRVELRAGWPRGAGPPDAYSIAPVVRGLHRAGCLALIDQITLLALLRRAVLSTAPDVVVSHIDMTNLRVLAAMHETSVPVVACEHTDTSLVSFEPWQRERDALYRRARAVVAPHRAIAEWLARRGAAARAIPNPLHAPPPAPVTPSGGGRRRIVSLARLSSEKRVDLLLRAFALVADDFPEWDVEVYGDGPQRAYLTHLAEELTPGRARLPGFADGAHTALGGADLFVSTSWVEGFGNAIWEALACGVPVVATDCGAAVRSLVRDGVDGLIVRAGDAESLASALASLMGDDAARQALASRAREVLTRFPAEASLSEWDALLGEAAGPARAT